MKKHFLITSIILTVALASCGKEGNNNNSQNDDKGVVSETKNVQKEVFLNGTPIILDNENAVQNYLNNYSDDLEKKTLTIKSEDDEIVYEYNYSDFDISFDKEEIIEEINNGNDDVNIVVDFNKEKVLEAINLISEELAIEPINATYYREPIEDGTVQFKFNDHVNGQSVDIETLQKDIEDALSNNINSVILTYNITEPTYTTDNLNECTDLLGTYYTSYATSSSDRNKNLEVAAGKINNLMVYPEETFSTAEAYGPVTLDNGFKISKVIINNKLVDGVGGGVCQISSTLYNAVIQSELDVVERRNHSLKVGYTPYAFDATMAEGYIDLKFANPYETPILVESYLDKNKKHVVVNIYGKEVRPENRTIKFYNSYVNSWSPNPDKIIKDNSKTVDYEVYTVKPKNGAKYNLYKDIYIDGELQETVHINTSTYKAVQGEKVVGTLPAPEIIEEEIVEQPIEEVEVPQETIEQPVEEVEVPQETIEQPTEEVETPQETIEQPIEEVEEISEFDFSENAE